MFIVEGRTLGVFAALGVALSMVVLDRLSDVADSTEPSSLPAFATASATRLPGMRHDSELAPACSGDSPASAACPPASVTCLDQPRQEGVPLTQPHCPPSGQSAGENSQIDETQTEHCRLGETLRTGEGAAAQAQQGPALGSQPPNFSPTPSDLSRYSQSCRMDGAALILSDKVIS
jgi:hypothetical protein